MNDEKKQRHTELFIGPHSCLQVTNNFATKGLLPSNTEPSSLATQSLTFSTFCLFIPVSIGDKQTKQKSTCSL